MPTNTELITKVGLPGSATYLAGNGHTQGDQSAITVQSTQNWPTDTAAVFAMDTVDSAGKQIAGSYTEWVGVVTDATTVSNISILYGTDRNYAAGATTRVYIPLAASFVNRLATALLQTLTPQGLIKANGINSSSMLADGVVTATKIADNLPYAKVDPNSIPAATALFSNYGGGAGQVFQKGGDANSSGRIVFDVLETNNHSGITMPSSGILQIATAGYYMCVGNTNVSDGTFPSSLQTCVIQIDKNDGVGFQRYGTFSPQTIPFGGAGPIVEPVLQYLPVGSKVALAYDNRGANSIRVAANQVNEKYTCSLSVTKVG